MNDKVAQGKLIGFGHAPYKDDEKNQPSYYAEIETESGKNKFWGLGLKDALERNNIKLEATIALLDKGIIEGTKKREWDVEKYEQPLEHKNSIENDKPVEKEKEVGQEIDNHDKKKILDFKKDGLKDDLELPESIKNNYTAIIRNRLFKDESINFYDRDDKNNTSIAFEDRKSSLNTSRSDDKTIKAMLDIAESKSWSSISLKGTEEFKQKAWLEASIRGIKTKGYEPTEKDLAELQMAQQERTNNKIQHEETTLKKDLDLAVPVKESIEPKQLKKQEQDLEQSPLSLDQKEEVEVDQGSDLPVVTGPHFENEMTQEQSLDNERSTANKELAVMVNDKKLSVSELSTVGEVKNYIGKFLAEELEKGNISSRDDVVNALNKEGFNVLKEETKTISIENPVGNRNIRLQGKMFEKGFNTQELEKEKLVGLINSYKDEVPLEAIQTVGVNKNTGMQNLRVTLDSYKDKIEEKDKVSIEVFKQVIEFKFKDNPLQMDKKLNDLAGKIPEIADGTYQLPEPPSLKKEASINVQVTKQGEKERGR